MNKRLALISLALLAAPAPARADAVAYTCRDNTASDRVAAVTEHGACVGFAIKDRRGRVTKTIRFGIKASGVLVSSADGRRVAMVQTGLYGGSMKGAITSYDHPPIRDPPVVLFYRDGKPLARHTINSLLVRDKMVSLSTSHVRWVHSWKTLSDPLGDTLTFETTSLREITFDTRTGKITRARDTALYKRCDTIAYGQVNPAGSGRWEMKPAFVAKGAAHAALPFRSKLDFGRRPGYKLLCFGNKPGGLEATEAIDILMNGLTSR